jgi:hypothetical protein
MYLNQLIPKFTQASSINTVLYDKNHVKTRNLRADLWSWQPVRARMRVNE